MNFDRGHFKCQNIMCLPTRGPLTFILYGMQCVYWKWTGALIELLCCRCDWTWNYSMLDIYSCMHFSHSGPLFLLEYKNLSIVVHSYCQSGNLVKSHILNILLIKVLPSKFPMWMSYINNNCSSYFLFVTNFTYQKGR